MKRGLILIDIQNDYFPGGNMELVGMEQAAENAGLMLKGIPCLSYSAYFKTPGSNILPPEHKGR
jgi:nicotinamidase-related amidase